MERRTLHRPPRQSLQPGLKIAANPTYHARVIEIFFLSWYVRKLSAIATRKGRQASWGGLGALFWILGELFGFVMGAALDAGAATYLMALAFAGIGAFLAHVVVKSLNSTSETVATTEHALNPHYNPSNPYSPPRGGDGGSKM